VERARCESALHERRGGNRMQRPGAGPKHDLVFTDRVLVTSVHVRNQIPHAALAELYGLERSTITRAIGGTRIREPVQGVAGMRSWVPVMCGQVSEVPILCRYGGPNGRCRRPEDSAAGSAPSCAESPTLRVGHDCQTSLSDLCCWMQM
jgi:hypothetical protein